MIGPLVNFYATSSGFWSKAAAIAPIVGGLGSIFRGLAGYCFELAPGGHLISAAGILRPFEPNGVKLFH